MSVIPATKEAEIRWIKVPGQPWANSSQNSYLKKPSTKKGWWSGSRYRPRTQTPTSAKNTYI
jgi:hypothetical protein